MIDNSGSMGGTSIVQAEGEPALRARPAEARRPLQRDPFRRHHGHGVLRHRAGQCRAISRAPRPSSTALEARGGTEMVPAMKAALTDARRDESNLLRQVVFLTDGAIGNEQQLFDMIADMRGRSRVFMVGIGSAPNSLPDDARGRARARHLHPYRLGRSGRGAHARAVRQAGKPGRHQPDRRASRTRRPTSRRRSLPDLYRGEPLVMAAKLAALAGTMEIKGRSATVPGS